MAGTSERRGSTRSGRAGAAVCVLLSGGLDSAALLIRLLEEGYRVAPCYLRCGFFWERAELSSVRRLLRAVRRARLAPLTRLEVPLRAVYGAHWSFTRARVPSRRSPDQAVYLPGRNVLLLAHAAVWCARRKISRIALGTLRGNPFRDASPGFFARMGPLLSEALGTPIAILTPFRHMTKAQLIRSMPRAPWALTCSCLAPRGTRHCGRCNKCAERARAFRAAGVPDPTRYAC